MRHTRTTGASRHVLFLRGAACLALLASATLVHAQDNALPDAQALLEQHQYARALEVLARVESADSEQGWHALFAGGDARLGEFVKIVPARFRAVAFENVTSAAFVGAGGRLESTRDLSCNFRLRLRRKTNTAKERQLKERD